MKQFHAFLARASMYLFLAAVTLVTLFPLIWIVMQSFKSSREIVSAPLALPTQWSIQGYVDAFEMAPILTFYKNSILVTVFSMALTVVFYSMAAYALSRIRSKAAALLVGFLSMSLYLPATAMIYPIFRVVNQLGMYDTKAGLVLVYVAVNMPMTLFLMRSQFLAIPRELEESAFIDGAGVPRVFFSIMLPIAKPGVATAAILAFIHSWNEFLFALILTAKTENRTLPLALNYFTSAFDNNFPALFAALVIVILPNIVVFVLMQERVISGMTAGAVKG